LIFFARARRFAAPLQPWLNHLEYNHFHVISRLLQRSGLQRVLLLQFTAAVDKFSPNRPELA
jgi:hypothetical protein